MRVFITGAGGFLGRALTERLAREEAYEITALTSKPDALKGRLGDRRGVRVLDRDALFGSAGRELKGAVFIGCAYPRNTRGTELADGFRYAASALERAAGEGCAAIVNISSQSVYPEDRKAPARETDPVSVSSVYAGMKYAQELLAASFAGAVPHTSLRLASLIGPGFDERVLNKMVRAAFSDGRVGYAEGEARYGFMDVLDAAEGIAALLKAAPGLWKPCYNLGPAGGYTLHEMALAVRGVLSEAYGREIELVPLGDAPYRNTTVDSTLFAGDTGFAPSVTLAESTGRIAEEISGHGKSDQSAL